MPSPSSTLTSMAAMSSYASTLDAAAQCKAERVSRRRPALSSYPDFLPVETQFFLSRVIHDSPHLLPLPFSIKPQALQLPNNLLNPDNLFELLRQQILPLIFLLTQLPRLSEFLL
jgi:hypothetical protein